MTKHSAEVAGRVEGFASAFFIDTRSRLLRLPASHAQATFWAKALLLLGNLPLVWVLSGAGTSAVAKQCLHVPGSSCLPQLLYFFISDSRGAVAPLLSISPCHQPTHPTGAGPLSHVQTRTHARTHARTHTHTHTGAVVLCTIGFVLRILLQMSLFWSRSIPWKEVVFEAGGIIPISFASFAFGASERHDGWHHVPVGLALFLFGTWLNVWSEWQRFVWKLDRRNQGHLYMTGLFGLARHINYTGEVVSFMGLSCVTGASWTLWVPVCMGAGMATFSVWEIEFYLAQRYRQEWPEYLVAVPYILVPGLW